MHWKDTNVIIWKAGTDKKKNLEKWKYPGAIYNEETESSIIRGIKLDFPLLRKENELKIPRHFLSCYTLVEHYKHQIPWSKKKHRIYLDRKTFANPDNLCLNFLLQMASMFEEMDNIIQDQHAQWLTSEKANAFHFTPVGIFELIQLLFSKGYV